METEKKNKAISIILIDDEASVLFALKLLLQALGYEISDYNSPVEALDYLRSTDVKHDLCICDLKMPKFNGLEVLTETKKISNSLPFILMSAHATPEEINKAKELGASGFLAKPFSPEQLKAMLAGIGLG